MADYFTNFSFVCPLKDEAHKDYAIKLAEIASEHRYEESPFPDDFPSPLQEAVEDWFFEMEVCDEGIWLHSDSGGVDAACAFVQHLLQKFNPKGRVTFEWSHDCSKHRADAFGGGAAFITAAEIQTFTTSDWLASRTHLNT